VCVDVALADAPLNDVALNDSTFQPAALQSAGGNEAVVGGPSTRRAICPRVGMDEDAVRLVEPEVLRPHTAILDELSELGRSHAGSISKQRVRRTPNSSEDWRPSDRSFVIRREGGRGKTDRRVSPEVRQSRGWRLLVPRAQSPPRRWS
jgi:hypothetical protein